jgi:hypothetical protein
MSDEPSTDKKQSARRRVLKKYPRAACIEVSGCTYAIFKYGRICSPDLLALAHTKRGAWAEAARK